MLLVTEHTPLKSSMMEKKNLPPQTTLEVDTFIGIFELTSIDTEALTFTAWIEASASTATAFSKFETIPLLAVAVLEGDQPSFTTNY